MGNRYLKYSSFWIKLNRIFGILWQEKRCHIFCGNNRHFKVKFWTDTFAGTTFGS